MKILFLPHNMASMPSLTAEYLNSQRGIEAKCFTISTHKYQTLEKSTIYLPRTVSKRNIIKWVFHKIRFWYTIRQLINWADVLHYTWMPVYTSCADLKYAKKKGKKIFVEWVGSEIRNPVYLQSINKYYKQAFDNGYEYASFESENQSITNQQNFAQVQALPLLCAEMRMYLDKSIFPHSTLLYQRINCFDFKPIFPSIQNKKLLLVHSPSAKVAKGSYIIDDVIKQLQKKYELEYILLHNMPREEVLQYIQKCDIFVDQIILGSYGMAAMEAMSFGKPVVCYLTPQIFENGLALSCPIVNASPDNLFEKLEDLINDAAKRNEIGKQSRAFVEQYHDVNKIANQLLTIYNS